MWRRSLLPEGAARVLVIGMGGGCDCINAYALARELAGGEGAPEVRVGNAVGPREHPLSPAFAGAQHVFEARGERVPLEPGATAYGTTLLEQSLPRDLGPPLVVVLPSRAEDAAERAAANCAAVVPELDRLAFDVVVGVDTGGDVLSGGIDFRGDDPELARDRQMLRVVAALAAPTARVAVFGLCSDGETGREQMQAVMDACAAAGAWDGQALPLEPLLPRMRELAAPLAPMRTPNIIGAAAGGGLSVDGPESSDEDLVRVPRHTEPVVPREWLVSGYVMDPALVPELSALGV